MTLWLDSATIVSRYVRTDDKRALQSQEKTYDDRSVIAVTIESGTSFNIDVAGYMNDFRGCNPDVSIEEIAGTARIVEDDTQGRLFNPEEGFRFNPNETCTVVFSADKSAASSNFNEDGES